MDNRGNGRDSDRDKDRDLDRFGSTNRRSVNDRETSSGTGQTSRIDEEDELISYRSQIAPRNMNITTNRIVPTSANNVVIDRFYSAAFGPGIPMKPGAKSAAIVAIQENREREKRELGHLNDRFASYIERVRYLEAQNKKLQLELEHLRGKWGSETGKVKEMYEVEIREARRVIDETAKDRAAAELRAKRAEEETLKFKDKYETLLAGRDSDRQKIELLHKQLADNEADLNLFRRRLADLEDEQKRYRAESQRLILDIQRVTQDLDQETIARVQLENEKQSLEEEINFLKQIHAQEIEELKHANLIGTALDPSNFFKHELSNAIRDIREEYEQLNNHQRNELESWYRLKVTQAVQEIQSRRAIEAPEIAREREEVKKLRNLVSESRKDISTIRQRNGELENRIQELEELVQIERREGIQATNERDREIQELRARLEELGRDYDELVSTKSNLDAEIAIYRKLLEGEENRQGLKQIVANVEEQARSDFAAAGGVSAGANGAPSSSTFSYSRTYRTVSPGQEVVPSPLNAEFQHALTSRRSSNMMIDRISSGHRRRPATISLNVQWVPVPQKTGIYQWSDSRANRKSKTVTFFGTGEMRGQQINATTPPSSDYTDAYLSVFAPKSTAASVSTERSRKSVFTSVTPVRLKPISIPLSTPSLSSTIQTRLTANITNNPNSTKSNESNISLSTQSSIYSSNNSSEKSMNYSSMSTVPYSLSSSSTLSSNFTTSLHSPSSSTNAQSISPVIISKPLTTIPTSTSETLSKINRIESASKHIYKPLPPYSMQAYPPASNSKDIVSPTTSSSTRTTFVPQVSFQSAPTVSINSNTSYDRSTSSISKVEKVLERPETLTVQQPSSENFQGNEISVKSTKSIETLENTIKKYDTLISEISDVLASVSPLSSTISSLSPSKSLLDYSISSESSPTSQQQIVENDSLVELPTTINNNGSKRGLGTHLIPDESYDKIVTVITDLEQNEVSSMNVSQTEVESDEILLTTPVQSESEPQESEKTEITQIQTENLKEISDTEEIKAIVSSSESFEAESDVSTQISNEPQTILSSETVISNETIPADIETSTVSNLVEEIVNHTEVNLTQTLEALVEQTRETVLNTNLTKKSDKHVRWSESVVDNEDNEDSSTEVTDDENIVLHTYTTTMNEEEPTIVELSSPSTSISETQIVSSTESEILSSSSQSEELSSNIETLTTIVELTDESVVLPQEPSMLTENTNQEENLQIAVIPDENLMTTNYSVESPIAELSKAVTTRFISSDVYHGYLGEHPSYLKENFDNNNDLNGVSLIASLHEIIIEPTISLIENIQDFVSSNQGTILRNTSHEDQLNFESNETETNSLENQNDDENKLTNTTSIKEIEQQSKIVDDVSHEVNATVQMVQVDQAADSHSMKEKEIIPEAIEQTLEINESFTTETTDQTKPSETEHVDIRSIENDSFVIVESPPTIRTTLEEEIQSESMNQVTLTSSLDEAADIPMPEQILTDENIQSEISLNISDVPIPQTKETENNENIIQKTDETVVDIPTLTEDIPALMLTEKKFDEFNSTSDEFPILEARLDTSEQHDEGIHSLSDLTPNQQTTDHSNEVSNIFSINEPTNEIEIVEKTDFVADPIVSVTQFKSESENSFENTTSNKDKNIETNVSEILAEITNESLTDISEIKQNEFKSPIEKINETVVETIEDINVENENQTEAEISNEAQNIAVSNATSSHEKSEFDREELLSPISETKDRLYLMEEESYVSSAADRSFVVSEGDVQEFLASENRLGIVKRNWSVESVMSEDFDSSIDDIELFPEDYQLINEIVENLISDVLKSVNDEMKTSIALVESLSFEDNSSASGIGSDETVIRMNDRSESNQSTEQCETITNDESEISWTGFNVEKIFGLQNTRSNDQESSSMQTFLEDGCSIDALTETTSVNDNLSLNFENETQNTNEISNSSNNLVAADNEDVEKTRERSASCTEDDSLDLINALQGHSIVIPQLLSAEKSDNDEVESDQQPLVKEQNGTFVEKSLSSTSSPITSSDCYVSYAIHEMGDSSQDRLPALPLAADLPIYQQVSASNNSEKQDDPHSESLPDDVQLAATKEDDLTELDATENLTSYSDDNLVQRLKMSLPGFDGNLDVTSSTDDDADDDNLNDLEELDVTDLHRIVEQVTQHSSSSHGVDGPGYQRYDLITISSNSNDSVSKTHNDDFYVIPGFPGLWRPSADDQPIDSTSANDADDDQSQEESDQRAPLTRVKTHKVIQTLKDGQVQTIIENTEQQLLKSNCNESIDTFSRPSNDFSLDTSEADSFRTCASTINSSIVKAIRKDDGQQEEPDEKCSNENIYLIRERERGVSLPVTMKIDCDDMELRLSSSTPIEAPFFTRTEQDLPSPSTFSEPIPQTNSSSRASSASINSNDSEQKVPQTASSSWLNTINTMTTIVDGPNGPLEAKTTLHKSAKGPISVAECDNQGRYIIIENTSRSKNISLSGWKLRQEVENGETLKYNFPENCVLKSNQAIKIWTRGNEYDRRSGDFVASSFSSWHTGSNVTTTLFNADGKDRAGLTKKTSFS